MTAHDSRPMPEVTARPGGIVRVELDKADVYMLVRVLNQAIQPGITVLGRHRADGATPTDQAATSDRLRHLRLALHREAQLATVMADTVAVPFAGTAR